MSIKTTLICSYIALSLFACTPENDNGRVVGKWQGTSWNVKGAPSGRNASDVVFEFNPDGTYSAVFGAQKEAGAFRLAENKLYTTAKGQAQKMVQASFRSADTLIMDMNRAGTMEELVLVKN